MRKTLFLLISVALMAACQCSNTASGNSKETVSVEENVDSMALKAQVFIKAFPGIVVDYQDGNLIFADGSKLVFDDGRKKNFQQLLDETDPEDMLSIPYVFTPGVNPGYLYDPGRFRCDPLMRKVYGSSKEAVAANLVKVDWFGRPLSFTKVNGAADSLRAVVNDIKKHPEWLKYVENPGGSFYWRMVRGANRLSAHSFGIAVDICTANSNYWKWDNRNAVELDHIGYKNRIPAEIVKVFEKHGFIWGGNWYHYDTMHFEYRPELLVK